MKRTIPRKLTVKAERIRSLGMAHLTQVGGAVFDELTKAGQGCVSLLVAAQQDKLSSNE